MVPYVTGYKKPHLSVGDGGVEQGGVQVPRVAAAGAAVGRLQPAHLGPGRGRRAARLCGQVRGSRGPPPAPALPRLLL